jgi:type II secretory pathway pseudopilin PulG
MKQNAFITGAAGTTLIEVLMAVLLLALLAVAGGAHLYHARAIVATQRNRLLALELTTSRLEQIRASRPAAIEPPGPGLYYLEPTLTDWAISTDDPGETVTLNHHVYPIQSTIEWQDLNLQPGVASNKYLQITVTTAYRPENDEAVTLSTFYAP